MFVLVAGFSHQKAMVIGIIRKVGMDSGGKEWRVLIE
jgi:hypothetical protein